MRHSWLSILIPARASSVPYRLADRPPAATQTVHALREAFEAAPQSVWALVPEFSGKHGHPFVAGRDLIEHLLREPLTGNARDVEHRYPEHIQYLAVDDANVTLNINTPEDYAALLTKQTY